MSKSTQTDAPSRASDSARLRQSEEPESRTRRVLWMALVISTGLHLGLHFGLGELKGHPPALIAPPTELLVETIVPEPEPEPEPEVSEPEVSEPETPEPEPTPRAVRPTTDAAPEPPPLDETPPPEPEVLDLPGVVLTGPGTSNFAVPQGGRARPGGPHRHIAPRREPERASRRDRGRRDRLWTAGSRGRELESTARAA